MSGTVRTSKFSETSGPGVDKSTDRGRLTETIATANLLPVPRTFTPFLWSGWLTPVPAEIEIDRLPEQDQIELSSSVFKIGRHPNCNLVPRSKSVSRQHARIHRRQTDFYIEDMGTPHGTYVNDDRVLWCRLADGDLLRFGSDISANKWHFSRAAVRQTLPGVTRENSQRSRPEYVPYDRLVVTFWGCRGSIATPGSHTEAYGGNTTCLEIRYGDALFILDAGTGIRALSTAWEEEFGDAELDMNLFLSHLHWDHIQGFPFMSQAYDPRNSLQIVGVDQQAGTVREMLRNQMQGLYFPIPMEAMQARMTFTNLGEEMEIGGARISKMALPHPGGAHAYKFTVPGGRFVFATDCELNALCPNIDTIDASAMTGRQFPAELLKFFHKSDLLVIDCQYTDAQYQHRMGWGHNSVATVVDFCRQTKVRSVALTHHDPASSDADIQEILQMVENGLQQTMAGRPIPRVFAAREGMMVIVTQDRT